MVLGTWEIAYLVLAIVACRADFSEVAVEAVEEEARYRAGRRACEARTRMCPDLVAERVLGGT